MEVCPSGSGTAPTCTWKRKLCVSCSQTNSVTYMRIQTNNMPDHCYGGKPTVSEQKTDVTVKWNPTYSGNVTFSSQSSFDSTTCTPTKSSTVPSFASYYDNVAGNSMSNGGAMGWAVNGIIIFSSSSADNEDPYYPKAWSGNSKAVVEVVDACAAHPENTGFYHYHILPPCLVDNKGMKNPGVCDSMSNSTCSSDVKSYVLSHYANNKTLTVLGVAKDGRVIVGPYDSNGNLWDCSTFDQCGGMYLSDGSYVYPFTNTYPYTLQCFGPGGSPTYSASCTTNSCSASGSSSGTYFKVFLGLLSMISIFSFNL